VEDHGSHLSRERRQTHQPKNMQPNMKVEADIEECEFELLGSAGDPGAEREQGHQPKIV